MLHSPEVTVRATTGEAFTNEFLAALAGGEADRFKARFRDVDVLLIDDVQFLSARPAARRSSSTPSTPSTTAVARSS